MIVPYLLFAAGAALLVGVSIWLWRLWQGYARIRPEDERYERSVADLSDSQAHRMSDEQLGRPIDADTGWRIMVQRGARRGPKVKGRR